MMSRRSGVTLQERLGQTGNDGRPRRKVAISGFNVAPAAAATVV
jgi:hypothetical protein